MEETKWCVVTGGRGFAARHLVDMLIRYEMFSVRIADLGPSIDLDPTEFDGVLGQALRSGRAVYVSTDLRDSSQVLRACHGAHVVFHMAAPNSSINNYQLHRSVNVQGTKNVIDACVQNKVKRLIYTSSPSVVFDGIHGIINGDESLAYPEKHYDFYSATKAEGETLVLKANGLSGLLTCCIRPSSIFGPGDRLFIPALVDAARAGKSKFIIGDGNNMYDFTYVENVAHAHICAERALASEKSVSEAAAGQAYFITNMEPMKFWEFVSTVLEGLGYERPRIKIPASVVMPIAYVVECIYKIFGRYGMKVPQLIPSRIRLLSCSRTFNCSKAKDLLGYTPIVSLEEGIKRTIDSYPQLKFVRPQTGERPSKAFTYLGSGRVANTLLWKDKKQTLITLLILQAVYYSFIASGSTIISGTSKLLLLASVFLFIHGILPEKILGYTVEKIQPSQFQLSDSMAKRVAVSVTSQWNAVGSVFMSLCKGNDWILFLKIVLPLLIISFLGAISVEVLFAIGLPIAFVAFYVYEKAEKEIDAMASEVLSLATGLKSNISKKLLGSKKFK